MFRLKKINGKRDGKPDYPSGELHLLAALQHNKRTMYANGGIGGTLGRIDASRSHLNYTLGGAATPEDGMALWRERRAAAGITKPRNSAEVSAIEIVFTLPPTHMTWTHLRRFF